VPAHYKAIVMLAAVYLVTAFLTEILSNNAVAALMTPIAIGVAVELGANPRAFVIAVMFAASAAFSTPIGYQTNTYVYGIGGYKFGDFVKIGLPLNVLCFVTAMVVVPHIWPL
jgi:di/tricarboxylate transporter